MRVIFIPPNENEFRKLFMSVPLRKGGGYEDISVFHPSPAYARGGGLFSTLTGIAKKALPFLIKNVAPSVKEFGKDVLHDMVKGETGFKSSLKKRGIKALKNTGERILKGGVNRSKRNVKQKRLKKSSMKKKRRTNKRDVYDLI